MEEITTRFEIVRFAVKLADHETIKIQATRLREITVDEDLNEISSLLESRNYRQALLLMRGYVESLDDSFFHNSSTSELIKRPKKKESEPDANSLFDMMQPQVAAKTINLDDMLRMTEESAAETIDFGDSGPTVEKVEAKEEDSEDCHDDSISNYQREEETVQAKADNVIVDDEATKDDAGLHAEQEQVEPDIEEPREEDITVGSIEIAEEAFNINKESASLEFQNSTPVVSNMEPTTTKSEADDELEIIEQPIRETEEAQTSRYSTISNEESKQLEDDDTEEKVIDTSEAGIVAGAASVAAMSLADSKSDTLQDISDEQTKEELLEIKRKEDYASNSRSYPAISYIDQKFRNMRHQFPQVEQVEGNLVIDEVRQLLKQMATVGYTENDIKDAVSFFQEQKAEGNKAEAAQMLLLAAASESKYAQLLLARELFKGEVLKVDYPEAFTQINRLAEHDYPEAVCDLAQLYEYGYGIKKDLKTAQLLYEEAYEMGVERAEKHVERFSRRKGFLKSFFR